MKRISRSLSNFTSPGSVESFSSGVTTKKRAHACYQTQHISRRCNCHQSKVKLRVIILAGLTITYCLVAIQRASERGLLRLHIYFFAVSPPGPRKPEIRPNFSGSHTFSPTATCRNVIYKAKRKLSLTSG